MSFTFKYDGDEPELLELLCAALAGQYRHGVGWHVCVDEEHWDDPREPSERVRTEGMVIGFEEPTTCTDSYVIVQPYSYEEYGDVPVGEPKKIRPEDIVMLVVV